MDNIRKMVATPINDATSDFLDKDRDDLYEDFYVGKIVNNRDPDKLGRCRIRVYGIFDDEIPDNDLPWAMPDQTFVGSMVGNFIVPPVGTIVRVYFENGELYLPHYTTKVIDKNNLPSQRLTNYPNNMVLFATDDGDVLEVNRQTGTVKFTHNSDTSMEFKRDGSVAITKTGTTATKGLISIARDGTVDIESGGSVNIDAGLLGSINIGGRSAVLYCPDLQVCPITGSPLAVGTKIPGNVVKVP